jgi:hypothetical protein
MRIAGRRITRAMIIEHVWNGIRGAILDSLREMDWSPRDLRRKARRLEDAHNAKLNWPWNWASPC